ncbi:YxeA family protein [Enterococcus sp. AZ109]|uniref:YxeA family protein n=1 Tax=Enterococcus sp. AZ109 TaxID=2774634 RepID=UPI003F299A1A
MRSVKQIIVALVVIVLLLVGSTIFTKNSDSEMAGIMDKLNHLIKQGTVYVKTTSPESVNEYGTAAYRQVAADENGKTRPIFFNGLSELKLDHYLKLINKGAHIETYEEVSRDQVPIKALQIIDK